MKIWNKSKSTYWDGRDFYIDPDKAKAGWRLFIQRWSQDLGHQAIDLAGLPDNTIQLRFEPRTEEIYQKFMELIQLDPKTTDENLIEDRIHVVFSKPGRNTKYPWHMLLTMGSMFIVEGKTTTQVGPALANWLKTQPEDLGLIVSTREVPMGVAVYSVWVNGVVGV